MTFRSCHRFLRDRRENRARRVFARSPRFVVMLSVVVEVAPVAKPREVLFPIIARDVVQMRGAALRPDDARCRLAEVRVTGGLGLRFNCAVMRVPDAGTRHTPEHILHRPLQIREDLPDDRLDRDPIRLIASLARVPRAFADALARPRQARPR